MNPASVVNEAVDRDRLIALLSATGNETSSQGPIVTLRIGPVHLHRFQVFASVVRHLSVTKAAQELRSTQPAVSQILKVLEKQYGILLRRDGRGIELTDRGQVFYNDLQPILSQVAALDDIYGGKTKAPKVESLLLGGSHAPSAAVLPYLMTVFKKDHPSVDIELKAGSSPALQEMVLNSQLDLAVTIHLYPSSSLEMEPFREFEHCVFVSPRHPLATRTEIKLEELARFQLVFARPHKGHHRTDGLLSSMRAKGLEPNVLMVCEWPEAVKAVVRLGEAVGMLYRDVVAPAVNDGVFKIIKVTEVNLTTLSYVIYSMERPLSRNAQEFLELLRLARCTLKMSVDQTSRKISPERKKRENRYSQSTGRASKANFGAKSRSSSEAN